MTLTANISLDMTIRETLTTGVADATSPIITHSGWNTQKSLAAATTPPATKVAAFQQALVAGAATIDLTALVGTAGATVNGTGLKVQAVKIQNPSTNTNTLVVKEGATNGYHLLGASFQIILQPGEEVCFLGLDKAPDVASTAKTIDLTDAAVGGTESSNWIILLG